MRPDEHVGDPVGEIGKALLGLRTEVRWSPQR
jgi:hypothetical protein